MSLPAPARRWAIRAGTAAITATALAAGLQFSAGATAASRPAPAGASLLTRMYSSADPFSPNFQHAYRHGITPTVGQLAKMRAWAIAHPNAVPAASSSDLAFGGGVDNIGVTDGPEKVYLVFWGSQWGTQGTDGSGNITLSGDPNGAAPYLQKLFKGLGAGGELWSGVMTQYCQGVTTGSTSCPTSSTQHVGYPTGGALAGVWVDESTSAPSAASPAQIGTEAVNAASHFGNTTASANRLAQYDIVSPHGANPDNYQTGGFCAWHDWNGDVGVSSSVGDIAFTNMPYVTDVGTSCGENFVNSGSAGTLDGFSIVNGHEYAETVTDQNPAGGWTNSGGSENGDLCAWNQGGGSVSQDVSFTTGSFAMQPTWANDGGGTCEISHPIVSNGGTTGNTVSVNSPGNQTGTAGTATSLQLTATDSASGQTFTWSASGLPTGLSINSSTGLVSGTPTTAGTFSVTATATDTTGAHGSTSFTWTISTSGGGGCTVTQLLGNPGFETGSAAPWTSTAGVINPNGAGETAHSGNWYAWLDGYGTTHTDTLSQTVTIPAGCTNTTFSFWLHIDTAETTTTTQFDVLKITANNTTLATFSNLNHISGYLQHTYSLSGFAGTTVTLTFTGTEDSSLQTSFVVDDTAVTTG
ncbi:MAG TPA: putative Ig domain-containing protein [Streptosporangiaceae bacterium]|nr:putative Ig domain-containing protein [Streptosporangiaceae bacterium]